MLLVSASADDDSSKTNGGVILVPFPEVLSKLEKDKENHRKGLFDSTVRVVDGESSAREHFLSKQPRGQP
jgi:hypothetical protein